MATEFKTISLACPACNAKGQLPIFEFLDLSESSEKTRNMVLSGRVFVFTCASCGHKEPISYPMISFDDDTNSVISVLDSDNKTEDFKRLYKMYMGLDKSSDIKYRICDTTKELAEKLRIYEDNMDDRVIELMKMLLRSEISEEVEDFPQIKCTYKKCERGKIFFSVKCFGQQVDIDVPTSIYADIENTLAHFNKDPKIKDAFMVNYAWADKMTALMVGTPETR